MRRNISRHSHCDTCTSVDKKVWESCGEYCRLGSRLVVVGNEINSSLVEICHHRHPEMGQAGLGITHCRGRVSLRRPKVPLPVDKNFPHRPVLRHIDKSRVNNCFSVRVIVSRGIAANLSALPMRLSWREPQIIHGVEDATLGWFESVPNVR